MTRKGRRTRRTKGQANEEEDEEEKKRRTWMIKAQRRMSGFGEEKDKKKQEI